MSRELRKVINNAQNGNEEDTHKIMELFKPLILKNSFVNGNFDEDCYQELCLVLYKCIKSFKFSFNPDMYKCLKEAINKE